MIEQAISILQGWLTRTWLSIVFLIGLLPAALFNRLMGGNDLSGPEPTGASYWQKRESSGTGFGIRSNDNMIVRITGRSAFRNYLRCTTSPRTVRRLTGAFCLALLRPISSQSAGEDDAHLDPSIYAMY